MLTSLWCLAQGPAATAELAALVHGVAGLVGLLLTPEAPPAADMQLSIDRSAAGPMVPPCLGALFQGRLRTKAGYSKHLGIRKAVKSWTLARGALPDDLILLLRSWHGFAAEVQKRPHSAFPRELLRAVAAVSKALQGACGTSSSGGGAEAEQTDAEAAAEAVAAALLQVCAVLPNMLPSDASVQSAKW